MWGHVGSLSSVHVWIVATHGDGHTLAPHACARGVYAAFFGSGRFGRPFLAAALPRRPSLAAPPSLQPLTAARSYLLAAIGYWELGTDEGQEALGQWGWQEDEPAWGGYGGGGWGSWGSGSYGSDSWGKGGKGL